ncbi:hypothetical protein, partial [Desulfovibrio desulfuricans]|uniref:hypothetical protein n=1 Tax=Desulfovibrio desulfuricans TaxID=876 RepID=UPI0035B42450
MLQQIPGHVGTFRQNAGHFPRLGSVVHYIHRQRHYAGIAGRVVDRQRIRVGILQPISICRQCA